MSNQVETDYFAQALGAISVATLNTSMSSVPADAQFLISNGLFVLSDNTTNPSGTQVERAIVLALGPGLPGGSGTAAAITAQTNESTLPGGFISGYTVVTPGQQYVRPPSLVVTDSAGAGVGAQAYAQMNVQAVALGGTTTTPYSGATTVTASGGELAPGGTQATFSVTINGFGVITAVTPLTGGGPYDSPPILTIADPGGGSGQTATALLGVGSVLAGNPGEGYVTPVVTVTPFFKVQFPDSNRTTQAAAVQQWMKQWLQNGCNCPVYAGIPIVT